MFNHIQFLKDKFHNAPGVRSFMQAFDVEPPSIHAIDKWFSRGSIPGEWFPVLVGLLELDQGEPVSIAEYFRS